VRFYDRSLRLYETLSADLNFNAMFAQRGHLTLAHNDGGLQTMRWRTEVNKLEGIDSEVIGPEEIKQLVPFMDTSEDARYPILGALYHPPGGIIRHDAVVWGYARGADAYGAHIHQNTEVQDIDVVDGRVRGVRTNRGDIATRIVVNCTAGWSSLISDMAGVKMPISTFPLQAAVTESVKPFLDPVIVSGTLHVYVSQTDRGELVFGASVDPFASYSMRGSLEFTEGLAGHVLELMPSIAKMRVLRQWAGLCDMTPDFAPIMGATPVSGFLLDVDWGTYGFKAGPVSGETMAELIATGKTPKLIAPLRPRPVREGRADGRERSRGSWTLSAIVSPSPRRDAGGSRRREFQESGVVFSSTLGASGILAGGEATHDAPTLSLLRTTQRFGVPLRRRALGAPRSQHDRRRRMEDLPLRAGQPGGLDDGDLVP
jgi:sarcosine oxidase, subunit beta